MQISSVLFFKHKKMFNGFNQIRNYSIIEQKWLQRKNQKVPSLNPKRNDISACHKPNNDLAPCIKR